jgi:hypothetical protein
MLSSEQLQQLQYMRDGQLVISSNASTDLPEPVPPAPHQAAATKAQGNHLSGATPPRQFSNPNLAPHSLVQPVLYTTKQLLYRALWRL